MTIFELLDKSLQCEPAAVLYGHGWEVSWRGGPNEFVLEARRDGVSVRRMVTKEQTLNAMFPATELHVQWRAICRDIYGDPPKGMVL